MENFWKAGGRLLASLLFALTVSSTSAVGQAAQVTGLVLTNSSTQSNNPFMWLQYSSGNTGTFPIFEVSGGLTSSTLGVEITSQSNSSTNTAPTLSNWMLPGFGGLSLVQLGGYNATNGGQGSPFFSMCANQNGTGSPGGQGPACWSWQVQGGNAGSGRCSHDVLLHRRGRGHLDYVSISRFDQHRLQCRNQ